METTEIRVSKNLQSDIPRLNGQFILSDLQNFKDTTKTACSTKLPVLASNSASRLFSLRLDSTLRSQKNLTKWNSDG